MFSTPNYFTPNRPRRSVLDPKRPALRTPQDFEIRVEYVPGGGMKGYKPLTAPGFATFRAGYGILSLFSVFLNI